MSQRDLNNILHRISPFFIVQNVMEKDGRWSIRGRMLSDVTQKNLLNAVRHSGFNMVIQKDDTGLVLNVEKEAEPIVIQLPTIPPIHIILFLLTVITTVIAGSMMAGGNPFANLSDWGKGVSFSFALMMILGCHESGHYFLARKHKVDASLPYFIPAPTFIGTFGAFIKVRAPIQHRIALLEIGAAGPIAGFIVAVPALVWGLRHSQVIETISSSGIKLGDSILMKLLTLSLFPDLGSTEDVILHPVAFAGWIGLLVTMLNLLPIGQLDGGHIAYALLGERFNILAKYVLLLLIPMSYFSLNWLVWGLLILLLMRTTKHPPIYNIEDPLTNREKWIGATSLAIFILCFIPAPFPS